MRYHGDTIPTEWAREPHAVILPREDGPGVLLGYSFTRIRGGHVFVEASLSPLPYPSEEAAAAKMAQLMGAPADPALWRRPGGLGALAAWSLRWHRDNYRALPEGYTAEHPWDHPAS